MAEEPLMAHLLAIAEHSLAQTIIGLLVLVSGLIWLAGRLRIPYPIFLVLGGLAIAVLPLPQVRLESELVFLLFLPPLLYQAGLDTSWRDFRANLGVIGALAIGLVLATTLAVAWTAHGLLGLSWPAAFALGAIVSPPDAVAATSVLKRLRIPKRINTILEGESLVNDASALVIFTFAVAAEASGQFNVAAASWRFVVVSAGGVLIGYVVAIVACKIRERLHGDDALITLASLLVPYAAYLPAEWAHTSGVLAVVTCGLYVGRRLPRIASSEQRLRERAVWETLILLLNGVVFVLIGLQLRSVVQGIRNDPSLTIPQLVTVTLAIAFVVIVVRFAWNHFAAGGHRRLNRWRGSKTEVLTPRELVLLSWSGMRGIVSLATAIALPIEFRGRDPILFIAFGVILITLVGQGLTLGPLIKRLGLAPDDLDDREQALARRELAYAAVGRLDAMEMMDEAPPSVISEVKAGYDARIRRLTQRIEDRPPESHPADLAAAPTSQALLIDVELAALEAERSMLIKLRDDDLIADEILRHVQAELDLAELRLRADRDAH